MEWAKHGADKKGVMLGLALLLMLSGTNALPTESSDARVCAAPEPEAVPHCGLPRFREPSPHPRKS